MRGWVGSPILYVRRGKYPPQSRRLSANCEPEERRTRSSASRNFDGWRKAPRGRKRCESVNQVTTVVVVRRSHSSQVPQLRPHELYQTDWRGGNLLAHFITPEMPRITPALQMAFCRMDHRRCKTKRNCAPLKALSTPPLLMLPLNRGGKNVFYSSC